jgi:hypothetical protein
MIHPPPPLASSSSIRETLSGLHSAAAAAVGTKVETGGRGRGVGWGGLQFLSERGVGGLTHVRIVFISIKVSRQVYGDF